MTELKTFAAAVRYVIAKLDEQGVPCTYRHGCQLRNDKGHKCAIGWLIPDDAYTEELEGFTVSRLMQNHPRLEKYLPQYWKRKDAYRRLQRAHDSWADHPERTFAEHYEFYLKYGIKEDPAPQA